MVRAMLKELNPKNETRRIMDPQPASVEYYRYGKPSDVTNGIASMRDHQGFAWIWQKDYIELRGWRFWAPWRCCCCGCIISREQFAAGMLCPRCDTNACTHVKTPKLYSGPRQWLNPFEANVYKEDDFHPIAEPEAMQYAPPKELPNPGMEKPVKMRAVVSPFLNCSPNMLSVPNAIGPDNSGLLDRIMEVAPKPSIENWRQKIERYLGKTFKP